MLVLKSLLRYYQETWKKDKIKINLKTKLKFVGNAEMKFLSKKFYSLVIVNNVR